MPELNDNTKELDGQITFRCDTKIRNQFVGMVKGTGDTIQNVLGKFIAGYVAGKNVLKNGQQIKSVSSHTSREEKDYDERIKDCMRIIHEFAPLLSDQEIAALRGVAIVIESSVRSRISFTVKEQQDEQPPKEQEPDGSGSADFQDPNADLGAAGQSDENISPGLRRAREIMGGDPGSQSDPSHPPATVHRKKRNSA